MFSDILQKEATRETTTNKILTEERHGLCKGFLHDKLRCCTYALSVDIRRNTGLSASSKVAVHLNSIFDTAMVWINPVQTYMFLLKKRRKQKSV